MDTNDTTGRDLDKLYAQEDEAASAVRVTVDISGLRPEFVHADPITGHPGKATVYLAGFGGAVGWRDEIVEQRRVVQEIDRQLARLEVEARIDNEVQP
jgi:hypothetical protein